MCVSVYIIIDSQYTVDIMMMDIPELSSPWTQATHQRHEEEQARIRKRGERQRTYLPATDEGWQRKVPWRTMVPPSWWVSHVEQRPKDWGSKASTERGSEIRCF